MFVYADRLAQTLIDIVRIPSTSGHEEYVRAYLEKQLTALGLPMQVDGQGNLIATMEGQGDEGNKGEPLLLCAHMDRVAPGLGHEPVLTDGVLYSDGNTNLGADDAAGITIILEVLRRIIEQQLPHPPLVILFTVQEESGRCGANGFDGEKWQVKSGFVFDNAFEAGVVISKGASYESFDVTITGKSGHPGKDLTGTASAIEIFRKAEIPIGILANDQTRINIGRVRGGEARNAIPEHVIVEGEIRSYESSQDRQRYRVAIQQGFEEAARKSGGRAEVSFNISSDSYVTQLDEPLLAVYQSVLSQRGATLQMQPTYIGSDTTGLLPTIHALMVSTGVVDEHTVREHVALAPLEQLVIDTLHVLHQWRIQTTRDH
ncbi:M20/M25/M40 family metallo-hydrolase [Ktedonobacteria bacterium brp13]|nr:M20/M25/M40 family metallo-hydrolase [Ktedonobacteria bacterium brp13]